MNFFSPRRGSLLFILVLLPQPYLSAEAKPRATITRSGNEVLVSADAARPLLEALTVIAEEYGWIVDYEDPIYSSAESRDVTDPAWRREHPKGRGAAHTPNCRAPTGEVL